MTGTLRHIALTVEQADGGYAWMLFESADGKVFVLRRAQRSWKSYLAALEAGYQELALLSACGLHSTPRAAANEPALEAELS